MPDQVWRLPQELVQPYTLHRGFTFTTTGDTAVDAVTLAGSMAEGKKIMLIVEQNDLHVEFDADATTSSMLIPAGSGYADDNIHIGTRISVINANAGQNGRLRGICWGR